MKGDKGKPASVVTRVAGAALPLYLTMIAASAGSLVDTAMLGRHATASLAAFAVTIAVFSPAITTIAGVLRGVVPFVAAHQNEPDVLVPVVRSGRWLALVVGMLSAAAIASVPLLARVGGVPDATVRELGVFPYILAAAALSSALGAGASSTLVGLGQGKLVMRSGLLGTSAAVVLSISLVGGVGPIPALGLPGAGIAMLASIVITTSTSQIALRRSTLLGGRSLRLGRPDLQQIVQLAKVGIPLAGTVLIKFAVLGVLAFAAARIGTTSAAVHSVSVSLVNLMFTAAVAVGQATVPLVAVAARDNDVLGTRRGVLAGVGVALSAVVVLEGALVLLRDLVIPLFTFDPLLRAQVVAQLPLILAVVVGDAIQAVFGFGLVGIKRTVPSLATFAACYGFLALLAVPLSTGGLALLWTGLACSNVLLIVGQAVSFVRHSGRLTAPSYPPASTRG